MAAAPHIFHAADRNIAQHHAVPGKGEYHEQIEPQRHAAVEKVEQVGEDIRRVGEKQQP